MRKSNKTVAKFLFSGLLILELLLVGSCDNWMSNDDFMEQIESEVHDANAAPINVYVRYANAKMGTTEPQGSTTMKVDVASKISAVTNDDYGFVRWAAFSTEDFATDKQHSKLTYISEEDYNENYKSKELSSEIVYFSDPKNPATDVKILAERNDIFIIPIVATRPSYVQSVPGAGDSNIVKNTSIRILFSKPINTDTIKDSEGNLNFNISTSAAVFTDDDKEMEANDITEYFDYSFSESKKMLTLKLKDNQLLDNRQYITVTLLEGLEDLYGFSMNGNYTFKFQTGTSTDSLAPMIEVIYGGTGDICNVFVTFGEDGEMKGTATTESKNAPKEIDSEKYTSAVIAQRVYDKLNIFVKANDIINSGNADINPAKDLSEDNVALIYISAGLYIDANGNPITIDETNSTTYQIGKKSYTYISGTIDQNANLSKQFTDMVPLDKDGNKYTGGMIYSYDVSNLPDGLIRIDVWAGDMTGNAGGPGDKGAPFIDKHDNGFKSIFVVKDTTPIDSAYVKANKQVISNSALAPYFWYNNSSLGSMELFDSPSNKIHDAGHEKLRALDKNLWWTFKVGNVTEKISKDDSTWKRIHDETDGTTSLHYNLANATAPSVDGPVDITLYLKDDMGNLSEPVLLDSIMYDNTAPSVSLKSGKGDFVNEAGNEELHASDPKVIEQILKVTIAESNENNTGSGIRRMEIHVKKGNEEVEVPLDATTFKVLYAPSSIENPTPSSEGIRQIAIQTAEADSATTNTVKVFNVTDADKITDGTLFIYGLTLGDTDGTYEVNVDLFDSALNKTPVTAVTRIARDTTEPVINKVQVLGAQARKVYGQNEETWWMPYDKFEDANNLTKVTLRVSANESGSGLKYIKLADNAEFTENTVLYVGDKALVRDVDYSLDIANKIIELKDWYTPLFINPTNGEHIITLENIKLNNLNAPAGTTQGNKILLTLDDFVDKSKSNENQIYYGETASNGTLVYADSIAPQIAYLHIADSAKHTANNPDDKGYNGDNYTDSQNVVLTLTFGDTEAGNKGSGVNQVILSDNAEFTSGTQIYYRNEDGTETLLAQSTDYEITSDTVTFKKVFTETDTLKFTNVKLVSDVQGEQSIKADVKDFAGIKSTESKPANVIIYDSVNPELYEAYWVAENNTVTAGTCNSEVINNQTLRIEFTEVTSGVKVIQLDITQDGIANDTPYATPFDSISQLTYEYNGTENLVKDVDYTVQGKYIVLNKTYTSGAFNIKGITLKNTVDQASYNVNITLLDASENKHAKATGIAIDTIAPEFTESLRVPALKRTVELTASGTTAAVDGYWLNAAHVNGSNKAADSIPVYIKIREKSSGIKVITFAANAVISEATTLWLVDGATETEVDHSIYTIDTNANTITINNEADARALFRKSDDSVFELLVKNVGLNQPDTETSASNNTIKMFLSDVAKNQNPDGMVQATPSIYSDSRAPNAPTALTLKDRKTTTTTIAASDGYTDESYVNMTFNLDNSEQFGSGYHKFVLSGATFIQNGADKTTLTLKDTAGNVIPNVEFDITDNNTTLILKRTNQTADTYTVVRQAVSVELKNVELANPTANENHTVSVTAYDLTGRAAEAVSTSIILDTQEPTVAPVFTAAFSKEGSAYDASLNVYPHPNGENGTGVTRTFGDKSIPTFYTKAKVDENDSSYNAVLGIHASDNICLGGNVRPTTFLYYVNDESFNMTREQIIASNTKVNPETGINGNRANQTCLWFKFPVGKYSAVVADEAGNISSVFRFNVEADDTVPAVTDFAEHVLFERPNADSDVYRNTIAASTGSGEFTYTSNESIGKLFMSRKYVTKKSGDKYRIVLNLGGAYTSNNSSAIVKKLDGSDAADALNYAELSADVNRAPIEKYAIVTTYTDWAASSQDSSDYVPVTPALTDALWHNYTAGGQAVTDAANNIVSFVDSNNNLVIELPNTQSTAPVTVFVRDGCGNYSHVLLGLDETSKTAVSYIVDGKLGKVETTNGAIASASLVQNPYLTVSTATSDTYTWDGTTYSWNNQSGNADTTGSNKGGVGQTRGFIKDYVKKATYYNPTLVSTNPFKIGLVLRVDADNQETVLFNESGKTTDTSNYTARAMIYCTVAEGVPTRQTIIKATSQASGVTGYNTGWVNVKAKQNEDNKIVILLDYPTPDYSTLGWTTNETNGEPKPFFIWYLFEDRVGNYEIAKVVNSAGSGTQLNQAYNADSTVFDRWLYDNEAPKITIRGTTTDPGTITAADINTLVATNNGFVPYVKSNSNGTSTVYVHASLTHSGLQDGATQNTNLGNGTTHTVDGGSYSPYSPYNPFMDLAVSEITGVRAFAWSNSENIDFGNSYTNNSYWYNGSTVYWYVGWGSVSDSGGLEKDIGNGTFGYSSYAGNAYFDTSISSSYSGKYSGTKVNTYIPYGKLSTTAEKELWLHVMDWTGNISHYRMGQNIKFVNDSAAPAYSSTTGEELKPNQYYMKKTSDSELPLVRFAGTGADAVAGNDIKVYLPENYFTEAGSGVKGYSFKDDGTGIAPRDTNGLYLSVPYDTYHKNDDSEYSMPYYVYDNVGNRVSKTLRYVFDNTAPSISSVSLVVKAGDENKFCDAENGLGTNDAGWTEFSSYRDYTHKDKNSSNTAINKPHDAGHVENGEFVFDFEAEELQEIYLNKTGVSRFHINLTTAVTDLVQIQVNRWVWKSSSDKSQGGEWKTYTGYKRATENSEWGPFGDASYNSWSIESNSKTYKMGEDNTTGYNLTYDAAGTYYQVLVSDISGNSSCQYFKLYLDNQAPKFSVGPTIENTIGSINKDSNGVGRFFAKSGYPIKINFTLEDGTGVGSKYTSSKLQYYYRYKYKNSFTQWYSMGNSNFKQLDIDAADAEIESIEVRDMFGEFTTVNINTTHPKFKYVYGDGANDYMEFDKIQNYTSGVAKPTYNIGGTNATIKTSGKMSPNNNDYVSTYTKLLNQNENTVLITSKNQKKLKIFFTKPAYVIGYLVTDGNGNLIPDTYYKEETDEQNRKVYIQAKLDSYVAGSGVPNTALHAYSGVTTLKNEFVETLPLLLPSGTLNGDCGEVVRKYYAVDIVGNISDPLEITYSYSDPNKAKDITLIESLEDNDLDSVKEADAITWMRNNVKFAKFSDTTTTDSDGKVKKNRFFNGDYIVLRCTLPSNSNTYSERPTKVELYDVWSGRYAGSEIRGSAEYSSNSDAYKIYPSTNPNADGRYYYYIAFKISEFDNHEEYNGSVIYAKIYGNESAESDMKCLLTDEEVRWKFDNQGPTLNERCYDSEGDIKYLKNYVIGSNINQNNNIPDDELNLQNAKVKDNSGGSTKTTIAYKNGSKLYIPVNGGTGSNKSGNFSDNLSGLDEYKIVAYSDAQALATATTDDTGWKQGFTTWATWNSKGRFFFDMPEVTTPHTNLALFLRDKVGNVSAPYYLAYKGENDSERTKYWIVEKSPETATVTTPAYSETATSYDLDVAMTPGVIIKKIEAVNASVAGIVFNDESGNPWSTQPTYNNDGTFGEGDAYINLKSLKITLNNLADTSYAGPQNVTLKINGQEIGGTIITIPTRKLSETDVELKQVVNDEEQNLAKITERLNLETTTEKVVRIKLLNGANKDRVSKIEVSGANFKGSSNNVTEINSSSLNWSDDGTTVDLVLTNIEQDWTDEKSVKLTITPVRGIGQAETTFDIDVFDVGIKPLELEDITFTLPTEFKKGEVNTFKLATESSTVKGRIAEVKLVETSEDGTRENKLTEDDSSTEKTLIYKPTLYKNLKSRSVSLKIKDTLAGNELTKIVFENVPALASGDITVTPATAAYDENNVYTRKYTIEVPGASVSGSGITLSQSNLTLEPANVGTVSLSGNDATVTVNQGWSNIPYTLKVYNLTPLNSSDTVKPKDLTAGDVTISNAEIPEGESEYKVTITYNNGASAANLTTDHVKAFIGTEDKTEAIGLTRSDESDGTKTYITLNNIPAKDWTSQTITLKIDNGNNITQDILTVDAITADDITLSGDTTIDSEHRGSAISILQFVSSYNVVLTVPGNRKIENVTSNDAAACSWSGTSNTATLTVYPKWSDYSVSLNISYKVGDEVKTLQPKVVFEKVEAIKPGEITIDKNPSSYVSVTSEYTLNIHVPNNEKPTKVEAVDALGSVLDSEYVTVGYDGTTPVATLNVKKQKLVDLPVFIKLNENSDFIYPIFTVSQRALTNNDLEISCSPDTWSSETDSYTVTIGIKESGAPLSLITTVTSDEATVSEWNSENQTVILTGITQTWGKKDIKIKVNGMDGIKVLEVASKKLGSENIILDNVNWTSGTTTYTVPLNLKDGDTDLDIVLLEGSSFSTAIEDSDVTFDKNAKTLTLTGINVTQSWSAQTVDVTISGDNVEGNVSKTAINVGAKELTEDDIILSGNTWNENGGITIVIKVPIEVGITSVEPGSSNITFTWNENKWPEENKYSVTNFGPTFTKGNKAAYAIIKVNGVSKTVLVVPGTDGSTTVVGAANATSRSIFGFRTKGNSYSTTSTSAGATSEAPKTRSVSLTSWVNDLFNNDSDAAVEAVKNEVKSSAKKAGKKSKKSAKTAKVEKATAEALAETSAAPVNELAETVAATVSAVTDVVEDTAPAVDEVSASLEAEAAAPLSAAPALPETSEESPSASAAVIILAIAALCAAAAALTIIALKKRAAKK